MGSPGIPTEEECRQAADQYEGQLVGFPNVQGVGIGNGCVNVYVSKKITADALKPGDQVPKWVEVSRQDGSKILVPTEVIEQDPLRLEE
ncbi:hypothetical protein ACIRRI_46020 [Streptomyces mirabilis]|uniref:hypothetical protein n=1 Tax=Streptomyces mirabilis TaxID=68239 RepID=UPI0037F512AB